MAAGTSTTSAPAGADEALASLAHDAVHLFEGCRRSDLAQQIRIAHGRLARPTAVVCVVGEYKQGKSSLVNALLGQIVCPVDDDLATSVITIVHHAPEVQVTVHRRDGDSHVAQAIDPSAVATWVTERGNPENELAVDRVEIGLPNRFLEHGPAVVDTPGAGGLVAGHAAATMAFLPFADAVLFVTDASAELSSPELDFLVRAGAVCPVVLVCLSKTDLYPQWRRISELDRGHLERAGLDVAVLPISSALRALAIERSDRSLNDESGFPELLRALEEQVLSRTTTLAADRLRSEISGAASQLAGTIGAELAVLGDPGRRTATIEQLEAARERLDVLKEGGARWGIVLGDRITDLSSDVNHRFRVGVRDLLRDADEAFEGASSSEEWTALSISLVDQLAALTGEIFTTIRDEARATQKAIADLLADEEGAVVLGLSGVGSVDPRAFWPSVDDGGLAAPTPRGPSGVGASVDRGLNLVRGAYGGVAVFGILARVLPMAAGSILVSNPFTLGAGLLFGAHHMRTQGARRVAVQRQQARASFRAAVEPLQQQVLKEIGEAVRSVQRELRDGFAARINELQRATAELIARCQEDAARDASSREQRRGVLADLLPQLEALATAARGPAPVDPPI